MKKFNLIIIGIFLLISLVMLIFVIVGRGAFLNYQKRTKSYINNPTDILVSSPLVNQKIVSPLKIIGKAKGNWFFEGTINAELTDIDRNVIQKVTLSAKGDWMTEDMVPFEGEVTFDKTNLKKGYIIIKNDNPSGLAENEKKIVIPINF